MSIKRISAVWDNSKQKPGKIPGKFLMEDTMNTARGHLDLSEIKWLRTTLAPIKYKCPHCGKSLEYNFEDFEIGNSPDTTVMRAVDCLHCEKEIVIKLMIDIPVTVTLVAQNTKPNLPIDTNEKKDYNVK